MLSFNQKTDTSDKEAGPMIRKFTSQIDGAVFEYRFNGINLELKSDGCDWSDFIPEDKRAYSKEEYRELMSLLKVIRNEPKFW